MRESEQFWCCVKHSRQSQPQRSKKRWVDGYQTASLHGRKEETRKEKKVKERAIKAKKDSRQRNVCDRERGEREKETITETERAREITTNREREKGIEKCSK